jgi:hypothetical protein
LLCSEFPSKFEVKFFENLENTSNNPCQNKPPVPKIPPDPLKKHFLKETLRGLKPFCEKSGQKMWSFSSEEIQIRTHS